MPTPEKVLLPDDGADWLQLDNLANPPPGNNSPTVAAPSWVSPGDPPTLASAANLPLPLAKPEIPGYEIVQELGRGGMGVVYKARQLGLNRWVALKMILGGVHAGSKDLARFQVEAEAVAQLRHPNIVQIYEIGIHLGLPFFALEFIDGGSLHEHIGGTPQPPLEAASIVATVARAIHVAHQKGILHRDLKPANILLERKAEPAYHTAGGQHTTFFAQFTPRITDFGLAKRLESGAPQTKSDEILGTPSYMAPEQAAGKRQEIGPAADIYALGAILYELLTGFPPFCGAAPMETVLLVLTTEPTPPRRFRPAVPRDLETICLKCLQKEPPRRYDSALALADDLRRFLYGEPIQARRVGRWEKTWRWCRRNPTMALLLALVLLLVLGGTVGWGWHTLQAQRRLEENERQVTMAVEEALRLRGDAMADSDINRLGEALGAARRARTLLAQAGSDPAQAARVEQLLRDLEREDRTLRTQQHQQKRDQELLHNLETARFAKATILRGGLDASQASPHYHQAFQAYGGDLSRMAAPQAIAWLKGHPSCKEVAAALDDWAEVAIEPPALRTKLRQIAKGIDPDPWRNQLREALERGSPQEIRSLAQAANMAQVAPASLVLLGLRLRQTSGLPQAVAFLRRAQWEYPQDYWLNFYLGLSLQQQNQFAEASQFHRIAVALKPHHPTAYFLLGLSFLQQQRLEEALLPYRRCVALKPDFLEAQCNLGTCLYLLGRMDEAEAAYRQAVKSGPAGAGAWNMLGQILLQKENYPEALACFRKAAALPMEPTLIQPSGQPAGSRPPQFMDMQQAIALCERLAAQEELCQKYLAGNAPTLTVPQRLALAAFCKENKRRPALAMKLYAEAFQREPALATTATHRLNAACAAVLAGAGQGKDTPILMNTERQRCRQQALTWLQAELAYLQEQHREDADRLRQRLQNILRHPDLATVRDPHRLRRLPDEERRTWEEFWTQVREAMANP
jgi:serine/threonine-protein kinase